MEKPQAPHKRRTFRNVTVGATVLAVVVAWFALARPPEHSSIRPSPPPSPTNGSAPLGGGPSPVFSVGRVRLLGQVADLGAYRGPAGTLCVELATEGTISCDFVLGPRRVIHLANARWLYMDSAGYGFGIFLAGTIGPRVASVRVSLGRRRWVNATIVTSPPQLEFPFRLFYIEKRTGIESLNRSLPVVALNGRGREIGRTSYLVQGG